MKRSALLILAAVIGFGWAWEKDRSKDDMKARIAKAEQGPLVIDVSSYPKPLQETYKRFAVKCARCHKISRPINFEYALPDEWEGCVNRMRRKFFSGINEATAGEIYEFLVYDSSARKKALIEEKLAALAEPERKAAQARIAELRRKYGQE